MSMPEFRQLAAKMDQHRQQLSAQGVHDPPAILHRMLGYLPALHKIWTGTTDDQLRALTQQFPGFYRYALLMEEASEAERDKASRPYDGLAPLSGPHQQQAEQLLTTAATLERSYQALLGSGSRPLSPRPVHALDQLHRQWRSDLESFLRSLQTQGVEPKTGEYVKKGFGPLVERLQKLAGAVETKK